MDHEANAKSQQQDYSGHSASTPLKSDWLTNESKTSWRESALDHEFYYDIVKVALIHSVITTWIHSYFNNIMTGEIHCQ